jgi:uncharacterized protein YjbI with pentapeptide repeats/class 3 adenylate cyclase/CHAT domain-containing protein
MAEEPQDQVEEGEDVEKLLGEFGTLYAALTKHQRPMAILFADLKGSTAIFGERSDLEGLLFVQRSESLIRPAVKRHSGNVVKTIGDAVMASFPSADEAVLAAIAIQHALVEHNRELSADDRLSLRIGVNTGKGFVKDQDIFGQVVNIAAKVQAEALGDQILVSRATLEALGTELARLAGGSRSLEIKGVAHPVEICEIRWQEEDELAHAEPLRSRPLVEAEEERKVLVLDLSLEADRLKVSANERSAGEELTLTQYQEIAYPGESVEELRADFIRVFNQANRKGVLGQDLLEELKGLGQRLFDALLPMPVKQKLQATSVENLIVHIDDKLVQIPWELIFDGQQFLSKRFNMGRVVRTRQAIADVPARSTERPLKMLILANPKGDLEASHQEAVTLRDALSERGAEVAVELAEGEVTVDYAKTHLQDYDIVHFAGHAEYQVETPEASAWLFHDGGLTSSDILNMAGSGPLPALVFSNACQSGYTEEWRVSEHLGQEIYGLANAFLLAGVQHYIGTFWEVPDAPSAQFALAFYSHLIKGASVGEALRLARRDLVERFGKETVIWASYMLYGDPTVRMFQPEPTAMPAPARAPVTARAPREEPVAPPKEARRSGLGLGAAAAVVALLLVGGGLYMMSGSSTKGRQAPPSKATAPSPAVAAKKPPLTRAQVQRILTTSKNLDFQNLSGLNLQTIDLTGASLKGSDLSGVNLSGARLERANLAEANLRRANLAKADLKGADLTSANLAEANLAEAQFWGGNLAGADLRGANAAGANFPHASLKGADFSKADLRGANFFEANLEGARFTGANLGEIQNIWRAKNTDKAIDLKLE